jgi:hypothetical protein
MPDSDICAVIVIVQQTQCLPHSAQVGRPIPWRRSATPEAVRLGCSGGTGQRGLSGSSYFFDFFDDPDVILSASLLTEMSLASLSDFVLISASGDVGGQIWNET